MNMTVTISVNTVSEITSWITFSCMMLNGPPLSMKPILLAGTCAMYSNSAIPHENRITMMSGQLLEIFISLSFRCPYHANVMNRLDITSSNMVQIPFTIISICFLIVVKCVCLHHCYIKLRLFAAMVAVFGLSETITRSSF